MGILNLLNKRRGKPPTPREMALEIVKREGGYADDPDDPGGETNYGVTLSTLRRLNIDLDGDKDVDSDDLRELTPSEAADIFLEHYYMKPKINELAARFPVRGARLRASVFDMNVNAGLAAIALLQNILNGSMRLNSPIAADGRIGPATLRACNAVAEASIELLTDAYAVARRNYYYQLGDRRPASRKYCERRDGGKGGWIQRAEAFMTHRYHYTESDHRRRVEAWR